mgnify:CR=1 FL=1
MKLRVVAIILLLSLLLFFGFKKVSPNKNKEQSTNIEQLNILKYIPEKNKLFGAVSPLLLSKLSVLTDDLKIPIKWTTKMWAMANNSNFVNYLMGDKVGSGSWVFLKFFRTLFEASPEIEPENFDLCPLLFLQPEKDYIIPWSMSKPFYDALSCPCLLYTSPSPRD